MFMFTSADRSKGTYRKHPVLRCSFEITQWQSQRHAEQRLNFQATTGRHETQHALDATRDAVGLECDH